MIEPGYDESANRTERLAFTYCKIATFSLIAGRFALPLAAVLTAGLYFLAWRKGKRESRCYLRYPLLIAVWWVAVFTAWVWWNYFR